VYSSDRKRARETARLLFKKARIIPDRGLREINFGILEGLRYEEIMKRHADIYKRWLKDSFKNSIPKAEPMNVFKKRVEDALWNIVRGNRGKTVAVVCHGGVIGVFVSGILKRRDFWRCIPSAASITIVEHEKGRFRLKKFSDTARIEVKDE
jgi:broad specificity phosphatase PhoE